MTPVERIAAAHQEFLRWRPPAYMTAAQRDFTRGDRRGTGLARLIGRLEGLLDGGALSPESLAEVVELALQVPESDLVYGRPAVEPEPEDEDAELLRVPFVQASPAEVAAAYESSAAHAAALRAEDGRTGYAGYRNPPAYGGLPPEYETRHVSLHAAGGA